MLQNKLFSQTFILVCTVGALNFLGESFSLYWATWWYDDILHFVAGSMVASVFIWIFSSYYKVSESNENKIIFSTLLFVLLVGSLWEMYELYIGATSVLDGTDYFMDTFSDLILDVSGGCVSIAYSFKALKQHIF